MSDPFFDADRMSGDYPEKGRIEPAPQEGQVDAPHMPIDPAVNPVGACPLREQTFRALEAAYQIINDNGIEGEASDLVEAEYHKWLLADDDLVSAAPLPDEVAEMVRGMRWLKGMIQRDADRSGWEQESEGATSCGQAADMLERQQRRIAELEAQRERADIINWHRIHTPDEQEIFYLSRLPSIRTVARTLGYAIGVHGSMRRDLDLIAVPWVEKHSTPDALAKAIQYAACGMHGDVVTWQQKPCGRIATSLPICWTEDNRPSSGHIDLSVMVSNVEAAADRRRADGEGNAGKCRY